MTDNELTQLEQILNKVTSMRLEQQKRDQILDRRLKGIEAEVTQCVNYVRQLALEKAAAARRSLTPAPGTEESTHPGGR